MGIFPFVCLFSCWIFFSYFFSTLSSFIHSFIIRHFVIECHHTHCHYFDENKKLIYFFVCLFTWFSFLKRILLFSNVSEFLLSGLINNEKKNRYFSNFVVPKNDNFFLLFLSLKLNTDKLFCIRLNSINFIESQKRKTSHFFDSKYSCNLFSDSNERKKDLFQG